MDCFQVRLFLELNGENWRLVEITALVQSKRLNYPGNIMNFMIQGLNNPLSENMMETISKGVQSKLDQGGQAALLELFKYLNKLGIQLMLETILAQSDFLSKTRWSKSLTIDSSELKNLRIFFWASNSFTIKRYILFSINEEKSSLALDEGLSAKYSHLQLSNEITYTLRIDLQIVGNDDVAHDVLSDSAKKKINSIVLVNVVFLMIKDPKSLDLEEYLFTVTEETASLLLKGFLDSILSSLEYRQGFFKAEIIHDSLKIDFLGQFSLSIFVDSISGRIRAGSDEKGTIPLMSLFEDKINEPNTNIVLLLMFLLYEVIDRIV